MIRIKIGIYHRLHRPALNPLSHANQGYFIIFICFGIFWLFTISFEKGGEKKFIGNNNLLPPLSFPGKSQFLTYHTGIFIINWAGRTTAFKPHYCRTMTHNTHSENTAIHAHTPTLIHPHMHTLAHTHTQNVIYILSHTLTLYFCLWRWVQVATSEWRNSVLV